MKKVRHLTCVLFAVTLPLISQTGAFADDQNEGPNSYEQRYGSAPPSSHAMEQSPGAAIGVAASPNYPLYDDHSPFNAYQQRYGNGTFVDTTAAQGKKAEVNFSTFFENDPSSNVNGGSSYGLETTVYSATIDKNWRLFAGELFSHELEPDGEGHINYSRSTSGIEFDSRVVRVSAAPTFNSYNGNDRVGLDGDAVWTINDIWAVGGGAQLFSRNIPLRALNAGITGNSYNTLVDWYQEDVRDVRLNFDVLAFSDDNTRTSVALSDTEHLYETRHLTVDGLATIIESQNSKDEFRPYFNPRQDVLGLAGARVGQPLYKSASVLYEHMLEVKPGVYWQENYGSSPALTASYTHHLNYQNDVDASLGIIFTRQDSDGAAENDLAVSLNLTKKF